MNNESEAGVKSVAPFCPLSTIEKTNVDLLTITLDLTKFNVVAYDADERKRQRGYDPQISAARES